MDRRGKDKKELVMCNIKKDKIYWSKLLRKNKDNWFKKFLFEAVCKECAKCGETIYNYNVRRRPFKNLCVRCTARKEKKSERRKSAKVIINPISQKGIDYLTNHKVRIKPSFFMPEV